MKVINTLLKIYFLISIIALSAGFIFLYRQVGQLTSAVSKETSPTLSGQFLQLQTGLGTDACGKTCQNQISEEVAKAVATISANSNVTSPTPAPVKTATPATKGQIVFIPLAGPSSTTGLSWVDVPGTDIYIDLVGEYGKGARAWWDAFLSVANSNGQAFARLYDATHGIAVSGSEISLTDTAASTQVSSGELSFWAGRNLYRVQIKSLNSFVVTFGSGRIKIAY